MEEEATEKELIRTDGEKMRDRRRITVMGKKRKMGGIYERKGRG